MEKYYALFKIEFFKLIRTPIIMFFCFVAPQFFLWMQSTNSTNIFLDGEVVQTVDYSFPMFTFLTILVIGIGNVGIGMSYNRLIKFFKRLRLSGVSTLDFIVVNFFLQFIIVLISVGLLAATAVFSLNMRLNSKKILIFSMVFILVWCMVYLIGMIFANITKDAKSSQSFALVGYFFLIFISGATYPIEMMPELLQKVSKILPTYPAITLLKDAWMKGVINTDYLFVVMIATVIFFILSIKIFKYD